MTRRLPKTSGGRLSGDRIVLDLDRHVPYFFTHISNRLSRGASRVYLKHFGIGITEWRVMGVLAGTPDLSANHICGAVGLDKAAVSRSLQVLVKRDLVAMTDDPRDNRSRTVALTLSGLALHDRIIAVALERERLLLDCLSAEEREAFIAALRKLRGQVKVTNAYDPSNETGTLEPGSGPGRRTAQPKAVEGV